MDTAFNLSQILDIFSTLDADVEAELTSVALLERVLPVLLERLPEVETIQTYDVRRGVATLLASVPPNPNIRPLDRIVVDAQSGYARAMERVFWIGRQGLWIAPLRMDNVTFGFVQFGFGAGADEPSQNMDEVLRLIVYYLTSALYSRRMRDLVGRQATSLNTIHSTNSPPEILNAAYNFVEENFDYAHLALVKDLDAPNDLEIVAELSGGELRQVSRPITLGDYPAADTLPALEALNVSDVQEDAFLEDAEREALLQRNVRSLVIVPLMANMQFSGLLMLTHPTPKQVPPREIRALRSLADQIAVILENQSLLQATETSLAEVRTLYTINSELVGTLDMLDVLRVLKQYVAPDAALIGHVSIQYDERDSVASLTVEHTLTPERESVSNLRVDDIADTGRLADYEGYLVSHEHRLLMVDDVSDSQVSNPLLDVAVYEGLKSFVSMVMYQYNHPGDLITIGFDHPRTFSEVDERLFRAVADQLNIVIQNQQLLRETQVTAANLSNQVRILQSINELALTMSSNQQADVLMNRTAEALVKALNVDHCSIDVALQENPDEAVVVSEYPKRGMIGKVFRMRGDPVNEEMNQTLRPVVIENVETNSNVLEVNRKMLREAGVAAFALVPLINTRGRRIGSFSLNLYERSKGFNPDMLRTAQTLATQLAIGLENIELLQDTQQRAEQLERVAEFSQIVQSTLDVETILKQTLEEASRILETDQLIVAFIDENDGSLRAAGRYEDGRAAMSPDRGPELPTDGTMAGQVLTQKTFLNVPDARETTFVGAGDMRALMVAPIFVRGDVVGVVSVGKTLPYSFTETDVAVFQQLVVQVTLAVQNAQAYVASQRNAQNQALVNEISARLQQQTDIESMLGITVDELGRAIGARRARIRLTTSDVDGNGSTAE